MAMPHVVGGPQQYLVPPPVVPATVDVFSALDKNHDGVLTRDEFMLAGRQATCGPPPPVYLPCGRSSPTQSYVPNGQFVPSPSVAAPSFGQPMVQPVPRLVTMQPAVMLPSPVVTQPPVANTVTVQPPVQVLGPVVVPPPQRVVVQNVQPVLQEVVREVPRSQHELHTIFRGRHDVEYVEKPVMCPVVECQDVIEEVNTVLMQEVIEEVPHVLHEETIKQVPNVEYEVREKAVRIPKFEGHERIVEVPQVLYEEVLAEVPEVRCIELIREVPKMRVQKVPKQVERPVVKVHERVVEVPQVTVKEQIVPVPVTEVFEIIKEVAKPETQRVEKQVALPQIQIVDKVVEVPQAEVVENPVEVPEVEVREVVKQVPKYEIRYVDKKVIRHQVEYVEKLVEIPHIVYEERVVEVPEVERVEIIRHKPKTRVEQVQKKIPKHVLKVQQKQVAYPTVLQQERPVAVPQVQVVEAVVEVPKPQVELSRIEIPKIVAIQPEDHVEEDPVTIHAERPVEVSEVQVIDAIKQVVVADVQLVDKSVPAVRLQEVEVAVEVPQAPLIEEHPVPVPQVQVVEAVRQELVETVQVAQKQVPKVHMQYREHVMEKHPDFGNFSGGGVGVQPSMPYGSPAIVTSRGSSPPRSQPLGAFTSFPSSMPVSPRPLFRQGSSHMTRASSHVTTRPASPTGSRPGSVRLPFAGNATVATPGLRPPPSDSITLAAHDDDDVAPVVTELDRDRPPLTLGGQAPRSGYQYSGNFGTSAIASTAGPGRRVTSLPLQHGSCSGTFPQHVAATTMVHASPAAQVSTRASRPATVLPSSATVSGVRHSPQTVSGSMFRNHAMPPTGTLPPGAF
eukprot:TRINITY_DN23319_c0_g1_i1.p1 TRINITY_DN23319_c0_g1~~TRINITY_DN23319_c0_g1_i1.p1  ORF type:complete len:844 (+),score=136.31 TRINITY_DN23319_c0_g1_i1:140-2671(+)